MTASAEAFCLPAQRKENNFNIKKEKLSKWGWGWYNLFIAMSRAVSRTDNIRLLAGVMLSLRLAVGRMPAAGLSLS